MMHRTWLAAAGAVGVLGVTACVPGASKMQAPVTAANHTWFPINTGSTHAFGKDTVDGPINCDSCHRPSAASFSLVRCDQCHKHTEALTARLHLGMPASFNIDTSRTNNPEEKAEIRGANCYGCHPTGERRAFSHVLITNECAQCHAETNAFAALPRANFTHRPIGTADCGACHVTTSWASASSAPGGVSDPTRTVVVDALQPTWAGPTMLSVTPDPQSIPMTMNHAATAVDADVLSNCANCHAQADQAQYYPGVMHWSLTNIGAAQPVTCLECHGGSAPSGFVGALDARRSPSSGEMKHDAVVWSGGAPTTTKVVTAGCNVCHQAPNDIIDARWKFAYGRLDGGTARFHSSLDEASLPQPTACLDCHANTRPTTLVQAGSLSFDHGTTLGECRDCHSSTTQWSGGQFHPASGPAPTTCLPCHQGERPTSTSGWSGTYQDRPFDYVTNVLGQTHGADQDCVVCHSGPGTGSWGGSQNWQAGHFSHGSDTLAATTCLACHTTQRPDRVSPPVDSGFDHAASGTGDCVACHQATVTRGSYANLLPIPGGDWRDGQTYPGGTRITAPGQFVRVQSTALNRTGPLVMGMTTSTVTLPNAFLHTSVAIPAEVAPGPANAPDESKCWHCHTATGTTVTAYSNGRFHAALSSYRATPGGAVSALPQPGGCLDCHVTMRPPNIVSRTTGPAWLHSMDHNATFTGGAVPGVAAMDCSACHNTPGQNGTQWADGQFHPNVPGGATPADCVGCHYPLMTTSQADVTNPGRFAMKHRSGVITQQACTTCHDGALGRATNPTTSATLWQTGALHASVSPQPTACLDCHAAAAPTAATQGTATYVLPQGGTASNGAQWMNHSDTTVTGRDCATCHAGDAQASGGAWNRATTFHARVASVTVCNKCHGLTNGGGTVPGTGNNLPAGLVDTATVTTATPAPANTHDQIDHKDSNVTRFECGFCHSQVGPSTAAGVQGHEWAQATFHRKFTAATPLVMNATGRCSNCHVNVKPGSSYAQQDHAGFTATSSQDCSSCHSWPGTSATTPNWRGATGAHASSGATAASTLDCNTCHGQNGTSSKHLAVAAASHYGGISNGNRCTSCHINFAGFKNTVANLKYGHSNAAANSGGCVTCHAFSGQLYATLTNTPALTRPTTAGGHQFSQTQAVTGTFDGEGFSSNHGNSGLTRCGACHVYAATTASTNIWAFKHRPNNPGISNSRSTSGCTMCH